MAVAKKIFPLGKVDKAPLAVRILFASEGYRLEDRRLFLDACSEFVNNLLNVTPFNHLRLVSTGLSVYAHFIESTNIGPAIDAPASVGRTAFESSFNSSTKDLEINFEKISENLDELIVNEGDDLVSEPNINNEASSENIGTLLPENLYKDSLLVLLLPESASYSEGIEKEFFPGDSLLNKWFIATSTTGIWYQVVLRAICKLMGLGDEYFSTDSAAGSDVSHNLESSFYNLSTDFIGAPSEDFKWYEILSPVRQSIPMEKHTHPVSNTFASSRSLSASNIALWEGGGDYSGGVFRSAKECLLRRKIGDASLPLRNEVLPLCPACEHYIKKTLIPFY